MQYRLDSALLDILKKDSDGRLGRWREQSIALGLLVTEAKRKVDDDVDDTDFKDIRESAVQLQVGKILLIRALTFINYFSSYLPKKSSLEATCQSFTQERYTCAKLKLH